MSAQAQAAARLLHWAWAANDRLASRLARLLASGDEPFARIDRVCARLEGTPVGVVGVLGVWIDPSCL